MEEVINPLGFIGSIVTPKVAANLLNVALHLHKFINDQSTP